MCLAVNIARFWNNYCFLKWKNVYFDVIYYDHTFIFCYHESGGGLDGVDCVLCLSSDFLHYIDCKDLLRKCFISSCICCIISEMKFLYYFFSERLKNLLLVAKWRSRSYHFSISSFYVQWTLGSQCVMLLSVGCQFLHTASI